MGTAITKSEKEALDELFTIMSKRENIFIKLQNSRKELIDFFKIIFKKQKFIRHY